MKIIPTRYRIEVAERGEREDVPFTVELRSLIGQPETWAVCYDGACLSKQHNDFEYEPLPSSRTPEWKADHRWEHLDEAVNAFSKFWEYQKTFDKEADKQWAALVKETKG